MPYAARKTGLLPFGIWPEPTGLRRSTQGHCSSLLAPCGFDGGPRYDRGGQAEQRGSLKVAITGLNPVRQTLDSLVRLAGHDRAASTAANAAPQTERPSWFIYLKPMVRCKYSRNWVRFAKHCRAIAHLELGSIASISFRRFLDARRGRRHSHRRIRYRRLRTRAARGWRIWTSKLSPPRWAPPFAYFDCFAR